MTPRIHTETLPNGFSFDMIYVEGGTFMMGDDNSKWDNQKPAHEVTVGSFWMGKYPVTQGLWKAVMGEDNNPSHFLGDLRPVENVCWYDAKVFIQRLNMLTNKTYGLPTETEWEYAARGGKLGQKKGVVQQRYVGSDMIKEVAWFSTNAHGETKEVGQKWPNMLDLYDMSGNVYEWCNNWFKGYPSSFGVDDYTGTTCVCRGGAWLDSADNTQVAHRFSGDLDDRVDYFGFRLAC